VKEQILFLESDDDLTSTLDKLSWVKTPHVILVWPQQGRILSTHYELVRIKRYAAQSGMALAFVTFDPDIRFVAENLGIRVASSVERLRYRQLQSNEKTGISHRRVMRSPLAAGGERHKPKPDSQKNAALRKTKTVAILLLLFVCAVGMIEVLLHSASIILEPAGSRQTTQLEFTLDPMSSVENDSCLPVRVANFQVAGQRRIPSSGRVLVNAAFSSGTVVFHSLTDQPLDLPAGTRVRTATGIVFRTLEAIQLGPVDQSVSVSIEALLSGAQGNVPAQTIVLVSGDVGLWASVENEVATKGGGDVYENGVSTQDMDQLAQELLAQLTDQALESFSHALAETEVLVEDSLTNTPVQVLYSAEEGQAAETLGLQMTQEFSIWILDMEQVSDYFQLQNNQLDGLIVPDSGKGSSLTVIDNQAAESLYSVEYSYDVYRGLDRADLQQRLRGLSVDSTIKLLSNEINLGREPIVRMFPGFLPYLPFVENRISIHWNWEE